MTRTDYLMFIRNILYIPGDEDDADEAGSLLPSTVS